MAKDSSIFSNSFSRFTIGTAIRPLRAPDEKSPDGKRFIKSRSFGPETISSSPSLLIHPQVDPIFKIDYYIYIGFVDTSMLIVSLRYTV